MHGEPKDATDISSRHRNWPRRLNRCKFLVVAEIIHDYFDLVAKMVSRASGDDESISDPTATSLQWLPDLITVVSDARSAGKSAMSRGQLACDADKLQLHALIP